MAGETSTRQRAMDAALELFSQRGYQAVSMGDIAGALGIKAPSLYKYFKGKEDLFQALSTQAEDHYRNLWAAVETGLERMEHEAVQVGHLTAQALESQGGGWFFAQLDDPDSRCYHRLVASGQAGDDVWLWDRPVALYEGLFTRLIDADILRRGDPHVMAVQFLAPLFEGLTLLDRDPIGVRDYPEEARRHIRQFHRVFAHREQRPASPAGRLFRR